MRDLIRGLAAGLAGAVLVGFVIGPSPVAYAETARTARPLHEAWYLRYKEPLAEIPGGDPSCGTPLGCNLGGSATRPAPDVSYPDNTLHVASSTGEPDAQTYLSFDLSRAPRGSTVTGGTMTFIAAPPESGTLNESRASMVACRVTEPFISRQAGRWADRPGFDPHTCSPLIRVPGARPATWTLHLAPFGARWSADANHDGVPDVPNYGITILPTPRVTGGTPIATWKVAFDSKRRAGGRPITSTLRFKMLTKPSDESSSLASPHPAEPSLATRQNIPGMASPQRPARSLRVPEPSSSLSVAVTLPSASGASDVSSGPLRSQVPRPERAPDAGQGATRGAPIVVDTDAGGFLGGHQAVWFVALLGFGVAGLMGWSLTSQAQLRGGFRWIAAMSLARRMPGAPFKS